MAAALRLLLSATLGCAVAGMAVMKPAKAKVQKKTKALLATTVSPDDQVPVDLMLEHQMRMLSGNMSVVEAAIIDNRPPWAEQSSAQEPILARYRRYQGATGLVQVRSVDYAKLGDLLNRFFGGSGNVQLSSKTANLAADAPTNLSKLDGKAKAARLLGMLNFLELCADADADTDLCIYVDSTTFVYRQNGTGVVELAAQLFQKNPLAVVLQPPDMCTYTRASEKGVCRLGNATGIEHGFFVINRERFEGFAPMTVERADLQSGFEDILAEGLTKGGVEGAVKRMRCGSAFGIHPYDDSLGKYACEGQQLLSLPKHTRAMISGKGSLELPHGHFESDYAGFEGATGRAASLKALIDRFEAGKFPEVKYPDSVTNKCLNMCPSRDRVKEGLAW